MITVSEDIIDDSDMRKILMPLIRKSPNGIHEDELTRKSNIIIEEIEALKVHAAMYQAFSDGEIEADVNEDNEVVWYPAPSGNASP